ncbi:ABC transporter permease [Alphaproteobacteria bacterium]|nr:ABC transporter permease [Alphaproteobacteria bacterium]
MLNNKIHSLLVIIIIFLIWEISFHLLNLKWYLLPPPSMIMSAIFNNAFLLFTSLLTTLKIAVLALIISVIISSAFAIIFYFSKFVETSLTPITVILQVTPIIAIAPLISIWVDNSEIATLICAFLVAFFPLLANTVAGLKSTEKNHLELVSLYGANKYQILRFVVIPNALPYFLSGLKISSGLALIGAIVGEFVIGPTAGHSGLAYRIIESGYQLDIPKMFGAVFLISLSGIMLFNIVRLISYLILRKWHTSYQPID